MDSGIVVIIPVIIAVTCYFVGMYLAARQDRKQKQQHARNRT